MRQLTISAIVFALAAVGLVAQARTTAPVADATVVARAASASITAGELRREVFAIRRSGGPAALVATATVEGLERVARELLDRRLLSGEARSRRLDRDGTTAALIARANEIVLTDALVAHETAAVDTSEASARRFFEHQPDRFRAGSRRKARHVVVPTREDAELALREVREGRAFADVAAARNTDATRRTGGDLGWVPPGLMVQVFDALLFSLAAGEIGGPVQTTMGWHLVLVEEIDKGTLPEFGLVREKVVEAMKQDALDAMLRGLRAEASISVDRNVLSELLK
jgi:peptidyl-prolyl cis-trans isomerase C